MSIYLINLDSMSIAGVFSSEADASIAGEVQGLNYYVGDEINLESYNNTELAKMAASVGCTATSKVAKSEWIARIVTHAASFNFAPPPPPKPEPEKKAKAVREPKAPKADGEPKRVTLRQDMYARLVAGEVVTPADYPEHAIGTFNTTMSCLRSPERCGNGRTALNVRKDGEGYRIVVEHTA